MEHAASSEDTDVLGSPKPGSLAGRRKAALLAAPKFVLLDFRCETALLRHCGVYLMHQLHSGRQGVPSASAELADRDSFNYCQDRLVCQCRMAGLPAFDPFWTCPADVAKGPVMLADHS